MEMMWCQGKQQPKAGQWLPNAIFLKSKTYQEGKNPTSRSEYVLEKERKE